MQNHEIKRQRRSRRLTYGLIGEHKTSGLIRGLKLAVPCKHCEIHLSQPTAHNTDQQHALGSEALTRDLEVASEPGKLRLNKAEKRRLIDRIRAQVKLGKEIVKYKAITTKNRQSGDRPS